jgi:hypothetical protein
MVKAKTKNTAKLEDFMFWIQVSNSLSPLYFHGPGASTNAASADAHAVSDGADKFSTLALCIAELGERRP